MTKESEIIYECGKFWVYKHRKGYFEIYANTITHSTVVATIGYKGDHGKALAIAKCDQLAAIDARHLLEQPITL